MYYCINTAYNGLFSSTVASSVPRYSWAETLSEKDWLKWLEKKGYGLIPELDFLVNLGTLNKIVVPTTENAATQILAENTELKSMQGAEINFAKISANSIWSGPNDVYGPDIPFNVNKKTEFERRGAAVRANLEESVAISSSGGLVVKIPAAIVDCAYSDKKLI